MDDHANQTLPFYEPERSVIPTTPKRSTVLTSPPAIASPIIGPDVLLWADGPRSPTLDTRKGRSALEKHGHILNLSRDQQLHSLRGKDAGNRRPDLKGSGNLLGQPRWIKLNAARRARQARARTRSSSGIDNHDADDGLGRPPLAPAAYSPGAPNDLDSSTWNISRQPGSTISFASFDPATASGDHTNFYAFRKLSLNEELCRPKRIVIETAPDGRCTWRFVPNAHWEAGVDDEGVWPRNVDVCGELMTISRDQWDMYKLNRRFDCVLRPFPNHTVITKSTRKPSVSPPQGSANVRDSPLQNKNAKSKRRLSDNVFVRRASGSNSDDKKKKSRTEAADFSSSSSDGDDEADEDEVNMIIDEEGTGKKHLQSERLKKRDKSGLATTIEEEEGGNDFDDDEDMMSWSEITNSPQMHPKNTETPVSPLRGKTYVESDDSDAFDNMSWTAIPDTFPQIRAKSTGAFVSPSKRKTYVETDESDALDDHSDYTSKPRFKTYEKRGPSKRTRTVSPGAAKRAFELRKNRRGCRRQKELKQRTRRRSDITEQSELKRLYEEVAELLSSSKSSDNTSSQSSPTETTQDNAMDEEAYRQVLLEESRRKIAELEKDRPLWEKQAQRRAAEEAEKKASIEAARKARAASQAADAEQERRDAKRHAGEAERQMR
ncbi:hypothetical protein EW145_g3331, partial [Phellinidium pouzarii]